MSLKLVVPAALSLAKNDSAVTTQFGADYASRITFNRAPQGMVKPYMTLVVGAVDYEPTLDQSLASAIYRIDYLIYTDTAEKGLTIMEELRDAIRTATHDDFDIRLLDEDYFVDVDGVHRISISSTWRELVTRSTRSFANVIDGDGSRHQVTTGNTYTCLSLPNDPLFADDYPDVEAIYSLRQMRRQYRGSAIRVRRGGDNAELGIGFNNDGTLDKRALEDFVSATGDNTGFVKIWYDQSGNNNHLTQEDMSKQPQIAASGSVFLEGGKPTVKFDGVNDDLRNGDEAIMNGSELTIVTVAKPTEDFSDYEESLVQRTILDQSGASNGAEFKSVDANQKVTVLSRFDGTAVELNDNVSRINQRSLYFANYKSGESKLSVNTNEVSTSSTAFTAGGNTGVTFSLGSDGAGNTSFYKGNIQEVILFNTEQTSSKVGIESDLQQYYSVYTPLASGMLQTFGNAHVGFSLRQLDVNYTGPCLEVRRDSDDTTKDIGFLVDGSLNVSQLLDFCGTGDGFVRTWYDQSGNGYDAVQTDADLQPRIVNDGAVEKNERGALCLNFMEQGAEFSSGRGFKDIGPVLDTAPHTAFVVCEGYPGTEESDRRQIYGFNNDTDLAAFNQFEVNFWESRLIQVFIKDGSGAPENVVSVFNNAKDDEVHLITSRYDATTFDLHVDSVDRVSDAQTYEAEGKLSLGRRNRAQMNMTEFVLYPTALSDSDCTSIETAINTYWSVWTPFTTGILDTYGSASFAYGLRRLNSSYTGPLVRIRRSTSQYDIGTTPDGFLDYSELRLRAGAQDAFVHTWYDQSGNGNHLVQTTNTLQAKIYDGTTVDALRDDENRVYMDCSGAQYVSVVDVDQPFTAAVTLNQGGTERILMGTAFFWSPTGYYHQRFRAGGTQIFGNSEFVEGKKHVLSVKADGANTVLHYDGVQDATGDPGTQGIEDGNTHLFTQSGTPPIPSNGTDRAYEMIVWGSDQLTNLPSIHQDMAEGYDVSGHIRPMDNSSAEDAVGAYGLRMLNSSWDGPCIRVRRDDNEQKDIYFDKLGNLDVKTLTDFVGSGDGHVVKWYDQSGRNNHGVQEDTLTRQPYIIIDGVVQRSGEKPVITFKQSEGSRMVFTHDDFINQSHLDTYMLTDTADDIFAHWIGREHGGLYSFIAQDGVSSYPHNIHGGYGTPDLYVNKSQQATGTGIASTNWVTRQDIYNYLSGRKLQVYEGAETTAASDGDPHWPEFLLEGYSVVDGAGLNYEGKIGEMYLFNQDNSSNRDALENHMNSYFGVWRSFTGAIVPIASNDNAAAAYSLRRIRSGWTGAAVELRRANGDTQDIGFDVEGNFDIGAAMIFCDGGAGTVVRWYDQTGNNRHAIASTSAGGSISEARQPTLVDNTGQVFTDSNGRARIRFNGVDDGLSFDSTVFSLDSVSSFVVGEFVNQNDNQMIFALSGPANPFIGSYRFYNTYMHQNKFKYGYGNTLTTQADANTNLNLHTHIAGSTLGNAEAFLNGSSVGTQTLSTLSANSASGIGMQDNDFFANCYIQEVILYDNDQSANRTTIEGNINDYYDIYD